MTSSLREVNLINHEAIRALGATMAQQLGELAIGEADREPIIATLNACADEVPYAELFQEDDRLADEIDYETVDHRVTDEELRIEIQRLDGLVRTISRKKPGQLETAQAAAKKKKEAAKKRVEAEKATADAPRIKLEEERSELAETLDTVTAAWPLPPYSQEVLDAAARREADEVTAAAEAEDTDEMVVEEPEPENTNNLQVEEKKPGPYAELPSSIPSLHERLHEHVSIHVHAHEGIETAKDIVDKAVDKPETERSEQEDLLLKAVYVLRNRYLEKPGRLGFLEVYGAGDIIELAKRLHVFSKKNRPDFDGLEGRILEKAAAPAPLRSRQAPEALKGAANRMDEDADGRVGMNWSNLCTWASRACDTMRARFFAGGEKNTHLKDYVIDVADKSTKKPDLSWVYQFVVDDFAFEILGERITEQQAAVQERFIENCQIITDWLEEVQELLDQIPPDFRLRRYDNRRGSFRMRRRQAEYDSAPAAARIRNTIKDIEIRRDGGGDSKVARHKPMKFDPSGAFNHQLRLGHMVEALKEELTTYDAAPEGYTEEITPFA